MPEHYDPDYPDPKFSKTDPKRRYLCRHIHASGQRCGSPAIRGRNFCYYHGTARIGFPASERKHSSDSSRTWFTFQHIDTRADIQLALFDVLSRLASNDLDTKRAGLLLYGLQIASANLPRARQEDQPAAPSIEHIDHTYFHGDLAPVQELPHEDSAAAEPATSEAVILSERSESKDPDAPRAATAANAVPPQNQHPHEGVPMTAAPNESVFLILNEENGKNPCIPPVPAQQPEEPTPTPPTNNEQRTTDNEPLTLCAAAEPPQDFFHLTPYSEILCARSTGGTRSESITNLRCSYSELTQRSIHTDLLPHQRTQHLLISAPVGFGNLDAEFALSPLQSPALQCLQCAFDLRRQ